MMALHELLRTLIMTEQDVFGVRRQGRQLAASLGLENQDQIRVAAALSEAGRRLLAIGTVTVEFGIEMPDAEVPLTDRLTPRALLRFRATVAGVVDDDTVAAIGLARGLMDRWAVDRTSTHTSITMARRVPNRAGAFDDAELDAIRDEVAATFAGTPLEELAEHNRQLLATLADVQAQRDELLRLNEELEATNRGVVALYAELSEELEATNRGVVALYAELDSRTHELRTASEAKTRFLANVTHELRSPVTSITGLTRLLRDPHSDPLTADQAQQLELVEASARSLLTLVNELLDLAKAESGRLSPVSEDTDLRPIFNTLRGTLRAVPTAETTNLVVDEPGDDVPVIHTDPIMLAQVLRNLLTNGLKFTPSGEVRLSAEYADGHILLVVSDTGIGIPEDERERVFEEFHQVRHPLQARFKGTGLGLTYSRRLVEALGGTLTLDSEVGRGSTFTVRLPVGALDGVEEGEATTVLVVDDDEAFRTAACRVLRTGGFTVREAADGRTALATIAVHPPDLILLDLRLAELDGFAVLAALEADDALRRIPVVVITAYPTDVTDPATLRHTTALLDKTETTLDDLCGVVRLTAVPRRAR
jgi:signal transduction histidine kinase